MRVTLIRQGTKSTLLLTLDHLIADGVSSILVLNDLLAALDGQALPALPLPMAQEDLITSTVPAAPIQDAPADADPRMAERTSLRAFDPTPPYLDHSEMSPDATTTLVNRCRSERTTVHAAIVMAASRVRGMGYGEDFVRTFSPINIRETVGQGPSCCVCIGCAITGISSAIGFWDGARRIGCQLNAARSATGLLAGAAIVRQSVPIDAGRADAERFFRTKLPYELLVTNLGVRDLPDGGPFRPRALWGPIVLGQVEREFVTGIITYEHRLRMVTCGHAPTVGFLSYVRDTLEQVSR